MKRTRSYTLLAGLLALVSMSVLAQNKEGEEKKPAKPKVIPVPVYLGNSDITGGPVKKAVFDSLLRQGLTSHDFLGRIYKVNGFIFTYGERMLYEDSVGNPLIITDNLEQYCYGDTLTTFLINNITDRSKGGDTVYFDRITLLSEDGGGAQGAPIKLVLTR